ncbi:hypothetical protein J8281_03540 [Aquimarina sp. U1-2]|uniref:hypothetical protein n=1 Tax=Aquimarina sp. U1-2 TaxID=2823141 RepID=UPI001AECAA4A|nr:hypothetical protein [Aquimarina sp. U1-2]MBP2831251.1 hypothetical protein [Aquimarina sp. U1-2]
METKANVKDSLLETGKNMGSGILGMLAGSAVGRHSLWLGAATIFGGAWYQYDWLISAGVGMVASNGFSGSTAETTTEGVDGIKDEVENAKNRALSSLKALGKKIYLDKLSPSIGQKLGLGALEDQPLVFVGSEVADQGDFDTSEVDEIIRQLEEGNTEALINGQPMSSDLGNNDILELTGSEDMTELNAFG